MKRGNDGGKWARDVALTSINHFTSCILHLSLEANLSHGVKKSNKK